MIWFRGLVIAGTVILSIGTGATPADTAALNFRRGASLVEFFNFPETTGEGAAKAYASPAYPRAMDALAKFNFDDLRRIGFDHMRVPVNLGPLMADDAQRRTTIKQLEHVIAAIHRHGLGVLVTLYPPSLHHELPETYLDGLDGPKFRRYFATVQRVVESLKSMTSGRIALEPMNEPQSVCRVRFGTDWAEYQQWMVEQIRKVAPDLLLFLTGGCWSNIEGIVLLDSNLLRDRRNFVSVHFYYPFLFTHQTATWTMPYLAGTIGVPYPASMGSEDTAVAMTLKRFATMSPRAGTGNEAAKQKAITEIRRYFREGQGRTNIEQWMKRVADWQKRQGIDSGRIVFTEFGAMKTKINGNEVDKASRVRWLRDTSSTIEGYGWGWTVYVLWGDPFGLNDRPGDRYPDPELLRALRLSVLDRNRRATQ
jgi:endoglucanase